MILFGQTGGMDFDEKTAYRYIYWEHVILKISNNIMMSLCMHTQSNLQRCVSPEHV